MNIKKVYLSYYTRLIIYIISLIIFLLVGYYGLNKAISLSTEESVVYDEYGYIEYANCCYDENNNLKCTLMREDNTIDKVILKFDYSLVNEKVLNTDFDYAINSKILLVDDNKKVYYEEEESLLNKKIMSFNEKEINISEEVTIDYNRYKNTADEIKKAYGPELDTEMDIYMVIKKNDNLNVDFVNNESMFNIVMPFSDREIINNNLVTKGSVILNNKSLFKGICCFLIAVISFIFCVCLLIKIIHKVRLLKPEKSAYDAYIAKILRNYEQYIKVRKKVYSFTGKEIIKYDDFKDLVNISKEKKVLINYYIIADHIKAYFYIVSKDTVYLHSVKAVDLEEKYSNHYKEN